MTEKKVKSVSLSLLVQMVVCALSVVSLLYLPLPILPFLAQYYDVANMQVASSLSAFGFAYAAGFLVFGALSDRLGRKRVIIWGLIALTVISLCLALATNWQVFIVLRVLQGLAAASFPPVALAYLSERGTPAQRMRAIAWMSTAFLAAGILGQIYAMQVVVPFGLAVAFVILALIYFATALRFIFTSDEKIDRTVKSWMDTYKPIFFLFSNHALRRVYLSSLLLLFCFVAFYLALDSYLGEAMRLQGIDKLQMRLIALPAFVLTLFAPKLMAWLKSPQRLVILGLSVSSGGLLLAALCAELHPVWILASSVLFVAGVAVSVPSLIARTASVSEPDIRGISVSFYTFVLFVGASLAPFLIEKTASFSLMTVLLILSILLAFAVIYNFFHQQQE